MYSILTAHIVQRQPNVAKWTYEEHNVRPFLPVAARRAPDPIRPHEASPPKPARMPFAIFYDSLKAMSRGEKWHLRGAHTVVVAGSRGIPRGRQIGFLNHYPIDRNWPQTFGLQVPEIEG